MIRAVDAARAGDDAAVAGLVDLLARALRVVIGAGTEPMLLAQLLTLPDEFMLGDHEARIDVDGVAAGLTVLRDRLGATLHDDLLALLAVASDDDPLGTTPSDIARRPRRAVPHARAHHRQRQLRSLRPRANCVTQTTRHHSARSRPAAPSRRPRCLGSMPTWPRRTHTGRVRPSCSIGGSTPQSGGRRHDTIERRVRVLHDGPLYDRNDRGRVMGLWFPFATETAASSTGRRGRGTGCSPTR